MKVATAPFLAVATLVMIQCSPLPRDLVPTDPNLPLSSEAFSIALMGDIPYSERQIGLFEELIKEVNADSTVDLVLHAGDIKGSGPCNNQIYHDRFDLFQKFNKPFIYTIGDNEWTDCHREENGQYSPLERLDFLRTVFFSNPSQSSGAQPIPVRTQSSMPGFESFVEHTVFLHKRITFGTVHVVGSNNNLIPWSGIDPQDSFATPRLDRLKEFQMREKAVIHWLHQVFHFAKRRESPGIVILIQANPRFELDPEEEERAGFNGFIGALRDLTVEYGKPVLLAHGHIHYQWIDKPLRKTAEDSRGELIPTFTRIQTAGSPFVRWIKITIDPQSPEIFLLVDPFVHKQDSIPW